MDTPLPYLASPHPTTSHHDRAASSRSIGSFEHDQKLGGYSLCWENRSAMETWILHEEENNTVEFIKKQTKKPQGKDQAELWTAKDVYVCARGHSGGRSKYTKKKEWDRAIPTKKIDEGCTCRLTIKAYPHTSKILGRYNNAHTHLIGEKNTRFTRLRKEVRDEIERLLRLGVEPQKVLAQVQGKIYTEENLSSLRSEGARRSEFCTRADVRRIEKMIEEETVRLASQDGPSVLKWVETLRERGHHVEIKKSSEIAPSGSGLDSDAFVLVIQTKYQQECWKKHGGRFAGIDATHNTTHYQNMSLFTLLVRDRWGHGMPAAWMISSNGTEDTINFFLSSIKRCNPDICPEYFMSDKDHAQINAIKRQFPSSFVLLCWWHVLHAWQQHFVITAHPELWTLLKKWIRIQDREEFWQYWDKIKSVAPPSVRQYLETHWMGDENLKLWSAVYRTSRNVFQLCDTNMLVEAWHHLLKGTFMQGKRNRRLDHLIHILIDRAIPHFLHKHRRQEFGFEGADLEVKRRMEIEERAKTIKPEQISSTDEPDVYQVQSSSNPDISYRVDLDAYDCSCLSFPTICFCKHICAVQKHFPETDKSIPTSAFTIHCEDTIEPIGQTTTFGAFEEISVDLSASLSHPKVSNESPTGTPSEIQILIQKMAALTLSLQAKEYCTVSESLITLHANIDRVIKDLQSVQSPPSRILPRKDKIAPNQHSWSETAAVMNVPVKSKRKLHTDAYSGGERSGKRACADAREPRPTQLSQPPVLNNQAPTQPEPQDLPAVKQTQKMYTPAELPNLSPWHDSHYQPSLHLSIATPNPLASSSFQGTVYPLGPHQTLGSVVQNVPKPPQNLSRPSGCENFDVLSVNISDRAFLLTLKRKELTQLCYHYRVSAGGTNLDIIARLLQVSRTTPITTISTSML